MSAGVEALKQLKSRPRVVETFGSGTFVGNDWANLSFHWRGIRTGDMEYIKRTSFFEIYRSQVSLAHFITSTSIFLKDTIS